MRAGSRIRRLALAVFLIALALSVSAMAGSLRNPSSSGPAAVSGPLPGQVLWTYYETTEDFHPAPDRIRDGCKSGGNGDNIIRLINPNGSANAPARRE